MHRTKALLSVLASCVVLAAVFFPVLAHAAAVATDSQVRALNLTKTTATIAGQLQRLSRRASTAPHSAWLRRHLVRTDRRLTRLTRNVNSLNSYTLAVSAVDASTYSAVRALNAQVLELDRDADQLSRSVLVPQQRGISLQIIIFAGQLRVSNRHLRDRWQQERTATPAPTVTPTPTPTPTPTLVWSDEFNGPAGAAPDPAKWSVRTGNQGDCLNYYTTQGSNASLDGAGHLAIVALKQSYDGYPYTTARIDTRGLFSMTYGSIQASIKLPAGQGLWPAFWAEGTDVGSGVSWPQCGEMDIMENIGNDMYTEYVHIHGPSASGSYGPGAAVSSAISLATAFHTYGVNWSPNSVQFTFDGVPCGTYTPASLSPGDTWVFNKPFFLILSMCVGGDWPGPPNQYTVFPATMLVDWVRVYSQ